MKRTPPALTIAALLAIGPLSVQAQTTVTEAWVRGTVAQQSATGAFMQLRSPNGGKLVGVSSPVADIAELHTMSMEGTTMRMRPVPSIELPAGTPVALSPGGFHVMLMALKAPLKAGDQVPLTLQIDGKDGKRETLTVKATVRALGAGSAKP